MSTRLLNRYTKLRSRRTDSIKGIVMLKEASLRNAITERASDAISYINECIAPIPQDYTTKTYEESQRIQDQLNTAFSTNVIPVEFDHQGSVTNNTHIKYHSDIDLLVASGKFVSVAPPVSPNPVYTGNQFEDLRQIRDICSKTLQAQFPKADVDTTGARSISISGGSLARKIDVVPCNWHHTIEYTQGKKHYKGIKILNIKDNHRETNYPFLHNFRINQRDGEVGGNLRSLIRLIKSIKSDSDMAINVSSYDITGLCYAMPPEMLYAPSSGAELLQRFIVFSHKVIGDATLQTTLKVPNETRLLVGNDGIHLPELLKLLGEGIDLLTLSLQRA